MTDSTPVKRYGVPERVMLRTDDPGASRAMPHDTFVVLARDFDALAAELAEMRACLAWAFAKIAEPTLIRGQNEVHVAMWERANAALANKVSP